MQGSSKMKRPAVTTQPSGLVNPEQFQDQTIPRQFQDLQLPDSDQSAIEWGRRAGKVHNAIQDAMQTWWARYEVKEDIQQYTDRVSSQYWSATGRKLGEDSVKAGAFASIIYVLIVFGGCIPATILAALTASWVVGAEKIQQEAKEDVRQREMDPDYPYQTRQRARFLKRFVEGYFEQVRGDPITPDLSPQAQDRALPRGAEMQEMRIAEAPPPPAAPSNGVNAQQLLRPKVFGRPRQPMQAPDTQLTFGDELSPIPPAPSRGAQRAFGMPFQGKKLADLVPPKPAGP